MRRRGRKYPANSLTKLALSRTWSQGARFTATHDPQSHPLAPRCRMVLRAMLSPRESKRPIDVWSALAPLALLVGCRGPECANGDRCADAATMLPDADALDVADERTLDVVNDRPTCEAGLTQCGARCTSVASDPQHCGACGSRCPSDQQCIDGRCACRASEFFCNDRCTPRNNSDPSHCGECGRRCEIGCSGGQCLRVLEVAHGLEGACARLSDDSVRCWGSNRLGGVGDGTFTPRLTPVDVPALRGARNLLAGMHVYRAVLPQVGMVGWGGGIGRLATGCSVPTPRHQPHFLHFKAPGCHRQHLIVGAACGPTGRCDFGRMIDVASTSPEERRIARPPCFQDSTPRPSSSCTTTEGAPLTRVGSSVVGAVRST